jgi:hypothetical protein
MSSRFINGAKYAVSTALAAAVAITAITNADPAVASSPTPPADGDILLLTSGWSNINSSAARAANADVDSFELEGVNTTNVLRFPAGEGAGTFQKVNTFLGINQVRDVKLEGGEQNYFEFQYVEDEGGRQRKKPTFKSASAMTLVLDYDPDLAWYEALIEIDRVGGLVVVREILPSGDTIYYVGTLAFNKVPTKDINQNMTVQASLSLESDPVRFGA